MSSSDAGKLIRLRNSVPRSGYASSRGPQYLHVKIVQFPIKSFQIFPLCFQGVSENRYAKKSTLCCVIMRAEKSSQGVGNDCILELENKDGYRLLTRKVEEKGVKGQGGKGAKAYFMADLETPERLVVRIGQVLAEQPF